MGRIVNISVFISAVFFLFVIILNINTLKLYLFAYDLVSKEQLDSGLSGDEKFTMGYGPLLFASIAASIIFLLGYFVQEESWENALRIALVTVFPFLVTLIVIGLGGIVLILGLALLGVIINRPR